MEIPIFSPQIKPAGTSWKRWLVTLALGISLGTLLFYYREPILAFAGTAWTNLSTLFSGLVTLPFFGNLFGWMQQNPVQTFAGIFSVGTSLFAIIKYYSEAKAKTAAITAQLQSQNALTNYQGQFQDYMTTKETQIQNLQAQISTKGSDTLQSALNESQGLVTSQATQIRSLQDQISALNNIIILKETQVIEKVVVK